MKVHTPFWVLGGTPILLLTGWTLQAQQDDSIVKVQVGDWVSMRQSGKGVPLNLKQTLIGRDDTTATIKIELSVGDKILSDKEVKVPLDQLTDPIKLAVQWGKAKVEKLKAGAETVEVKGKKLACEWMELKLTFDAGGKTIENHSKIWVCRDIPLNGVVKMANEVMGKNMTMELVDYGRAK